MLRFGMPMGPLELLDQIGLDVAAHVAEMVREQLGEQAPASLAFAEMAKNGWLGQKSGKGFYIHRKRSTKVNKAAQEMLRTQPGATPSSLPETVRLVDARERMVLLMVNEAARVLERGLANAETIDLAMVFGTGWAPHRGGPLRYATDRGAGEVVDALAALEGILGPRFAPCATLRERANRQQLDDRP
jgi:3-hydroxyacyl-CoA dehydrogenase/enoyl-CoA hydratase/3-hydroxybutyryl-CoA epimerase